MQDVIAAWPGKRDKTGAVHPAVYHMLDVAVVAEVLLERTPYPAPLRHALCLMIALHDLGKIGVPFRAMLRNQTRQTKHRWEMSEVLLLHHDALLAEVLGSRWSRRAYLYAASAGHHGRPPTHDPADIRLLRALGDEAIRDSAKIVCAFAALWPEASLDDLSREDAIALSWWLPGCVSPADWIGSNEDSFPFAAPDLPIDAYLEKARARALTAVNSAGLHAPAPSDTTLFDFALRPMQAAVTDIPLRDGPMLAVIEDETGAGKTEAALLLAQRMMLAGKGNGLYFALPTMATASAMFLRARDVVGKMFDDAPSLTLTHGRAALSDAFRDLVIRSTPVTEGPVSTDWPADNSRHALLAMVGVGTIAVRPADETCLPASLRPVVENPDRGRGARDGRGLSVRGVGPVSDRASPCRRVSDPADGHAAAGPARDAAGALWGNGRWRPGCPALTVAGRDRAQFRGRPPSLLGPTSVERLTSAEDALFPLPGVELTAVNFPRFARQSTTFPGWTCPVRTRLRLPT